MYRSSNLRVGLALAAIAAGLTLASSAWAGATVAGLTGTAFQFTAKAGYVAGGDGQSLYTWGYANGNGRMQYPGPTLVLTQGVPVTIELRNRLKVPVSIIFPGQENVVALGGVPGLLTNEVPAYDPNDPNQSVTYAFTPTRPGTFMYQSGTRPDLQVEMGLFGAILVRPVGYDPAAPRAYEHPDTAYDHEYLFLVSAMDWRIHKKVEAAMSCGLPLLPDTVNYHAVYWFLNGRNAPDVAAPNYVPWLPTQPYGCLPRMHSGERLLMRIAGASRNLHPFHFHGNNSRVFARDGFLLESVPGVSGPDLGESDFTFTALPGQTIDAVFSWTPDTIGFDITGQANDFPVVLPEPLEVARGAFYSGSPFLGGMGPLPPGEGGFNLHGGYVYMWHSHNEVELTNNDIFPGGLLTFLIIEPPGVPIP